MSELLKEINTFCTAIHSRSGGMILKIVVDSRAYDDLVGQISLTHNLYNESYVLHTPKSCIIHTIFGPIVIEKQ